MMGNQEHDYPRRRAVSLDDLVPADSFYRRLEQCLNLSFVQDLVRDRYSTHGRRSIDPVVFFNLQLGCPLGNVS